MKTKKKTIPKKTEEAPEYVDVANVKNRRPSSETTNSLKPNGEIVLAELMPLPLPKKYSLLSGSR